MWQSYVKALLVINRSSCCGGTAQTLHKSRHAAKAPPNMQSYLQAKNAECASSYANYATERALSLFLSMSLIHSIPMCVCVCGWVIRRQVGQLQSKTEIEREIGSQMYCELKEYKISAFSIAARHLQ